MSTELSEKLLKNQIGKIKHLCNNSYIERFHLKQWR